MTLVEALVVLALIAIGMAITIPNFRMYLVRSRVVGPVRDIERLVSVVRLRAINAQRAGVIVFVKEGESLSDIAAGEKSGPYDATNAVVAFISDNGDTTLDAGEEVVATYPLPRTLSWARPGSGDPRPTVRLSYTASGTLGLAAGTQVYLGDANGNYMRLVFRGSGQVSREKNVPGDPDKWLGVGSQPQWRWNY